MRALSTRGWATIMQWEQPNLYATSLTVQPMLQPFVHMDLHSAICRNSYPARVARPAWRDLLIRKWTFVSVHHYSEALRFCVIVTIEAPKSKSCE